MADAAHTCDRPRSGPLVNGVRIDPRTPEALVRTVEGFLRCGRSHVVHFLAADPTVLARGRPAYRDLLNRGDLNVPDGMPVALAARLQPRGVPEARRQPGTDSMQLVMRWGAGRGLAHYLYGGAPEVLQAMRVNLRAAIAGLRVVGAESPPFRDLAPAELDDAASRMREAGAEVVWVGLGTPKQDLVAEELARRDAASVICCVGAAFDFVAGAKARAPRWMQQAGLEWLHRLASEPRRLWRRYLMGNARFVAGYLADRAHDLVRPASPRTR